MNRAIYERIKERLKIKDMTARAACLAAGLGPDVIRDIGRKPHILPRLDSLMSLARVLDVEPEWLIFGVRSLMQANMPTGIYASVIGEVAAGVWHDVSDVTDEPAFEPVLIASDPRWPASARYGLVVRGTSIDRRARPGDVLVCIDRGIAGIEPRFDDVVIVERRRAQGSQKEVTAKVWRPTKDRVELWPDSDDPRWTDPIIFDPKDQNEDDEVAIIAVVDQAIRQLRR